MTEASYFNVVITTIFAREFLEGAVIILNYRIAIKNTEQWNSTIQQRALREVTKSAVFAVLAALLIVGAVAVILNILSKHLNEHVVSILMGISGLVAAICMLQLSLKIPQWLGFYDKVSIFPCNNNNRTMEEQETQEVSAIIREIRFTVAWNIWREIVECLLFLIPFFLTGTAIAVPLSALAGILIALLLGGLMYIALQSMRSKFYLSLFMSLLTGIFSVALFTGSMHDFEKVSGETQTVFILRSPALSSDSLPMALFEPFGYSSQYTILMLLSMFSWLLLGSLLHLLKYRATRIYRERRDSAPDEMSVSDPKDTSEETSEQDIVMLNNEP